MVGDQTGFCLRMGAVEAADWGFVTGEIPASARRFLPWRTWRLAKPAIDGGKIPSSGSLAAEFVASFQRVHRSCAFWPRVPALAASNPRPGRLVCELTAS